LLHNWKNEGELHGGSTITQQLAKNLFLTQERTLQRKAREVFFTLALEQLQSKDQILDLYLNEVYLGQAGGSPLHGVEQAARAWFGVSAGSLEIHEAATVAGVISAPNAYSPLRHPEVAIERRDLALTRMVATGAISAEQAERAKKAELLLDGVLPGTERRAPWVVDEAIALAEATVGEGALASRGYHVYTTLQPLLQRAAERAIADGIAEVESEYPEANGAQAALVAVRPDGAIVAMVGGRDWLDSPFNRAADGWREIGSTAKPFVLLAALEADPALGPLSTVIDEPIVREVDGKPWTPVNYDGRYRGEVTVRQAIESSLNTPAVRLSENVGPEALQTKLRDLGLSRATHFPSAALGAFPATPVELAGAYTVFPGEGKVAEPQLILGVADAEGEPVVVFEPRRRVVASARGAGLATHILTGVVTDGTAQRAIEYGVGGSVAAKTGTTQEYRDAWLVGFTPELVAAVWVGRDKGANLGLTGGKAALPAWGRFVAWLGPSRSTFDRPGTTTAVRVCRDSFRAARPACPDAYTEWLPEGADAPRSCDRHGGPVVEIKDPIRRPAEAPEIPTPTPDPSSGSPEVTRRDERALRRAERHE
jgi:membrane peptidoglycan carboxypeptidase